MRSRFRFSKKMIVSFTALAALGALYLHLGLFPGELKARVIRELDASLKKKISFSKALYLPFRGLSFLDLKVAEADGRPLFVADRVTVNVRLIPFLKDNRIVIADLAIDRPVYDWNIAPKPKTPVEPPPMTRISGQIAVPVVSGEKKIAIDAIGQGPDYFLPENVYLEQISISDGLIRVRTNELAPPVEEIRAVNIRMGFLKPPTLTFDGSFGLGSDEKCLVQLKGAWDLGKARYRFRFQTDASRVPDWLVEYQKDRFLVLKKGRSGFVCELQSFDERAALFHIKAKLKEARIDVSKGQYTGDMSLDTQGVFDLEARRFLRYTGELELERVNVFHLSKDIDELLGVSGRVHFEPDVLDIRNIHGRYKELIFDADGAIRSFKTLDLDGRVRVAMGIDKILDMIPDEQKKFIRDFEIRGDCEAVTAITGSLRKPAELKKDYNVVLTHGSIKNLKKKMDLSEVSATLGSRPNGFKVGEARFVSAKKPYLLNAFIPSKPGIPGRVELTGADFSLSADYRPDGDRVLIDGATFRAHGLTAEFAGQVAGLADPALDLNGQAELRLDELQRWLSQSAPEYKDLGLAGTVRGPFTLDGVWNKPLEWSASIDAKGDPVFVGKKCRLGALELQLRTRGGFVTVPYLHATPYGGTLTSEISFDLKTPGGPFVSKSVLSNTDLRSFAHDLELENKELTGTLNMDLSLEGKVKFPESYRGQGHAAVRGGKLWKTDQFKAMGHLPFVKVEGLDMVEFHDLTASFEVEDKRLWTEDLNLRSDTVDLLLKGSIGFDQQLDMVMDIRYSNDVIRGAYDTGGLVPFVVQQSEGMISQYTVSGTLKKPQYEKGGPPVGKMVGRTIGGIVKTLTR